MATAKAPPPPGKEPEHKTTSLPLCFIVASHPEEMRKRSVMRKVRSRAILDHLERSGPRKVRGPARKAITSGQVDLELSLPATSHGKRGEKGGRHAESNQELYAGLEKGSQLIWPSSHRQSPLPSPRDPLTITGRSIDPFHTLPQFSMPGIQVEELAYHCLGFLGTVGKSPEWVRTILSDRLAYLSHISVEAIRQDIVLGVSGKSRKTLAVEGDVVSLIKSKIMDPKTACSDETIFGVLHLLTGQIIHGDWRLLDMHIRGLETLVLQRGGLRNLGLRNEVANIISRKVMIKCVIYEQPPRKMHVEFDQPYTPWMQSYAQDTPESPVYWDENDRCMEHLSECCDAETLEILKDMRALTTWLLSRYWGFPVADQGLRFLDSESLFSDGVDPEEIQRRCFLRKPMDPKEPTEKDWIYEAVRLASLIYSTAMHLSCPISVAHKSACAELGIISINRSLVRAMQMTNTSKLWGTMSGCHFWICLVGAASASGRHAHSKDDARVPADIICEKMLRMSSLRNLQMLATKHSSMVETSCRNMLRVQKVLADAWKVEQHRLRTEMIQDDVLLSTESDEVRIRSFPKSTIDIFSCETTA